MKYDERIKPTPPNVFRSVLKTEHIAFEEDKGMDKIIFDFDNSVSITFEMGSPLTILDTRQFVSDSITDVNSDVFYNIVLAYLYINRGIDSIGRKHMATYLIKRYSKEHVRTNKMTSIYVKTVKGEMIDAENTVTSSELVPYLRFEDVYELINDIIKHNPTSSFDRMIKRDVYVLFSRETLLGFIAKKNIVLKYIGMVRKGISTKLIATTINELIEQDRILKITTGRISAKSKLSSTTIRNRITTELNEILSTHNEYRFINTEHSFKKLKEFVEADAVSKTAKLMCVELNISRGTYFQYKLLVNSLNPEELELIETLKY